MTDLTSTVADFRVLHDRVVDAVELAVHGKRARRRAGGRRAVRRRSRAARGRARHRQDDAGPRHRRGARRAVATHPVHARPAAGGRHRHDRARPGARVGALPPGTGLHARPARRRDQPRRRQDPVRAAGGHGRSARSPSTATTREVPDPFLVVATQNPVDLDGTYRLPEAQLDRFLVRVALGHPDAEHELAVLRPGVERRGHRRRARRDDPGGGRPPRPRGCRACTSPTRCCATCARSASRPGSTTASGWARAPAALRGLVRGGRCYAAAQGRHYVVPSDVQRVGTRCWSTGSVLTREAVLEGVTAADVVASAVACRRGAAPGRGLRSRVRARRLHLTPRGVGLTLVGLVALGLGLLAGYPGLVALGVAATGPRRRGDGLAPGTGPARRHPSAPGDEHAAARTCRRARPAAERVPVDAAGRLGRRACRRPGRRAGAAAAGARGRRATSRCRCRRTAAAW